VLTSFSGFETTLQDSQAPVDHQRYCDEQPVSGWDSDFVIDRALQATIAMTTWFRDDSGIFIHCFVPDDTVHEFQLLDWAMILASSVKVVEAAVLYHYGSKVLWWSGLIGWATCFLAAVALQTCNLGRDIPRNIRRVRDYLLADLPSYNRPGGISKKIILGQPVSVREHLSWKVAWAVSALSSVVGLIITFYALTKDIETSTKVVHTWAAFQACWLLLRTLAYYTIPDSSATNTVSLSSKAWDISSPFSRLRALRLLLAASIQQTQEHMRVFPAYKEDLVSLISPSSLSSVLEQTKWKSSASLPPETVQHLDRMIVQAVIGEELLRTIVWFTGTKIDNEDMYDAVAVLFKSPSGEKHLVPGVRVMSGALIHPNKPDPEATIPSFDLRGSVNKNKSAFWVYWIPIKNVTDPSRPDWLEIACEPFSVLGALRGHRVLSYTQLDKRLAAGIMNIGLKGISDLEKVFVVSNASIVATLEMIKPS
jgi:hypothetical protein